MKWSLVLFCLSLIVCKSEKVCGGVRKPNVSVIIPVFNGESTIVRCIWSVLNQTFRNIEIIAVDDGSVDSTLGILNLFAEIDSRLVIIHQENKGESHACNTGLALVKGEYVTFVHADDWIELDYYEIAFQKAKEYNADVVVVGHNKYIPQTEEFIHGVDAARKFILRSGKNEYYQWHVYDKLYRSCIIENNNVTFNESIRYGLDTLFNFDLVPFIDSILFINKAFYHYKPLSVGMSETRTIADIQPYVDAVHSSCMRMMSYKDGYKYMLREEDVEIVKEYTRSFQSSEMRFQEKKKKNWKKKI